MKTNSSHAIEGTFQHLIYSPRGEVEGVLLHAGDTPVQLVIGRHDEQAAAAFDGVTYARHGAANGVVLDTGDFIHTKPEGMARLRLKIGDTVEADGDAQRLVDDAGWAVEATTVNGKPVHPR